MATSVSLGFCLWFSGATFNDSIGRNQDVLARAYLAKSRGGILTGGVSGGNLTAAVSSGLSFTVADGAAVVPAASGDGSYLAVSNASQTLTCAAADPSNPRIDLVCIQVVDNGNNTSYAELVIVEGTPAATPAVPATPSGALALYQVAVAAGATTLSSGNLTDVRTWTAAPGGVIRCPDMSSLPAGVDGTLGYDVVNDRFFHLSSSGSKPVHVLSYPPAEAVHTSNISAPAATETTLLSVNFNSDGSDVTITGHYRDAYTTTTWDYMVVRLYIDSTCVAYDYAYSTHDSWRSGKYPYGSQIFQITTTSLLSNTPAAGAHTAKFTVAPNAQATTITGSAISPVTLTVKQASL